MTDGERRFAESWATDPEHNGTPAAKAAGYSGGPGVLAATASRLLRRAKVQSYIAELRREAIRRVNEAAAGLEMGAAIRAALFEGWSAVDEGRQTNWNQLSY